jgi:hypothetical protein
MVLPLAADGDRLSGREKSWDDWAEDHHDVETDGRLGRRLAKTQCRVTLVGSCHSGLKFVDVGSWAVCCGGSA